MSSGSVQTVILCEDTQTECFIRRFLIKQGWNRRQIRAETLAKGQGSGEQWVRKRFLAELKAYRSRSGRAATCLIVTSDADDMTVNARVQTFKAACDEAGVPFRQDGERVLFIIPRRNIETWLAYLRGEQVNEVDPYRKYRCESECRDQVARLDRMCRENELDPEPPPSLEYACNEFGRTAD